MRRKVGTVMRISTFWFCMKQGLVNICRNIWFSLASTAIISACIFLFCVFFSVITNIEYMVRTAETTMGITVFFDENLAEDEIKNIGAKIESDKSGMIKEIKFVSAEEAWDGFKTEYFGEDEALAEGFADDNPLAGSSSYEIRLNNITDQDGMVAYLESIDGVRKVNYSNSAATGLASFNKIKDDPDRDIPAAPLKQVARFIDGNASTNKQIFTYIFETIYKSIDSMAGHIDIMGEMYSEFLKYALGDGGGLGGSGAHACASSKDAW